VAALRGLLCMDTPAAWEVIRARAADGAFAHRETALEMLGHNDDPATRDLILRTLAEADNYPAIHAAWAAARRLWAADALEPHYAWLANPLAEEAEDGESIRLMSERGDARRVFELLPKAAAPIQDALATALLHRDPPPLAEAQAALGSPDPATARLAAQVVGRAGSQASAAAAKQVAEGIGHWQREWAARRVNLHREYYDEDDLFTRLTAALRTFLWAAGRSGTGVEAIVAAAAAGQDDVHYRPIRVEAVSALAMLALARKPPAAAVAALEAAATADDVQVRTLAAGALARLDPKRAAKLAGQLLADRPTFDRVVAAAGADLGPALKAAAAQPHYQGVALPHLIARGDLAGLGTIATNRELAGLVRLGAIEALGRLATEPAEAKLRDIGANEKEDEELRKAAWRARRRSIRARQKPAARQPAITEAKV